MAKILATMSRPQLNIQQSGRPRLPRLEDDDIAFIKAAVAAESASGFFVAAKFHEDVWQEACEGRYSGLSLPLNKRSVKSAFDRAFKPDKSKRTSLPELYYRILKTLYLVDRASLPSQLRTSQAYVAEDEAAAPSRTRVSHRLFAERGEVYTTSTPPAQGKSLLNHDCDPCQFLNEKWATVSPIGREPEFAALNAVWNRCGPDWYKFTETKQVDDSTVVPRIIVLTGWAGEGKSTVVRHWVSQKLAGGSPSTLDDCFIWSFYKQGTKLANSRDENAITSADPFLKAALEYFGDSRLARSNIDSRQKARGLAGLIGSRRVLLILDGIEPLQNSCDGTLSDQGLETLLLTLAQKFAGLCLITTRPNESGVALPVLNNWRHVGIAPEWKLKPLKPKSGAELLLALGVEHSTESERERLCEIVSGHALTLTLLGSYLCQRYGGHIRPASEINFNRMNLEFQNGHAFRVMDAYVRWFKKDDNHLELTILRVLGLFDRPVNPDCLVTLFAPPFIRGLIDRRIAVASTDDWNAALDRLQKCNLIQTTNWTPSTIPGYASVSANRILTARNDAKSRKRPGESVPALRWFISKSLETHPLIREYCSNNLREKKLSAWKQAHFRIFSHLEKAAPYRPEGMDALQPLYQAVFHACQAGDLQRAWTVFDERILRFEDYTTKFFGAFSSDLAILRLFFSDSWQKVHNSLPSSKHPRIFGKAGYDLRAVGRYEESERALRGALTFQQRKNDYAGASESCGHLCGLFLTTGNMNGALDFAKENVRFANLTGEAYQRMRALTILGDALHERGENAESREAFGLAERIQSEDSERSILFGVPGFRYCDLLLQEKMFSEVIRRVRLSKNWVDNDRDRFLNRLLLARAFTLKGDTEEKDYSPAWSHMRAAEDGLRTIGVSYNVTRALIAKAHLQTVSGTPGSRESLNEAWQLACADRIRPRQADCKVELARHSLAESRAEEARDHLSTAREIMQKTGYRRCERDVLEIERQLEKISP